MGQRYGLQLLLCIEELIGEGGDIGMHAPLPTQDGDKVGTSCRAFLLQQTLKERLSAGMQRGLIIRLLHHCRQLLVVANEDEAADAVGGQQTDNVWIENLRSLIYDAQ